MYFIIDIIVYFTFNLSIFLLLIYLYFYYFFSYKHNKQLVKINSLLILMISKGRKTNYRFVVQLFCFVKLG